MTKTFRKKKEFLKIKMFKKYQVKWDNFKFKDLALRMGDLTFILNIQKNNNFIISNK